MKKICFVLLFACLLGCRKDIPGNPPLTSYQASSFSQVFEAYWSGMNSNYVFLGYRHRQLGCHACPLCPHVRCIEYQ